MKGFVPTPRAIVDLMVAKVFERRAPSAGMRLLDPGCGEGEFIAGVLRWCGENNYDPPTIVGVELHPGRAAAARRRFAGIETVKILTEDFLLASLEPFDYIIGNPPYVSITGISPEEKATYRAAFRAAIGRFDLYVLFFEKGLRMLKEGGRLVFISPEKFLTVDSARQLRQQLAKFAVPEVQMLCEDTFPGLTTYPTITVVDSSPSAAATRLLRRDGSERMLRFAPDGKSLAPYLYGEKPVKNHGLRLRDICLRISCGVATGADRHFVRQNSNLASSLGPYAHPTVSGRQLVSGHDSFKITESMIIPYDLNGKLLDFECLNEAFSDYLLMRKESLLKRTCTNYKPWYAFHETPNLSLILQPKLLCKDVTEEPYFWIDHEGTVVPRHSVYYLIPHDPESLAELAEYLNSPAARDWLMAHCQRVRKGFIRLQSKVIRDLPVPPEFMPSNRHPLLASLTA